MRCASAAFGCACIRSEAAARLRACRMPVSHHRRGQIAQPTTPGKMLCQRLPEGAYQNLGDRFQQRKHGQRSWTEGRVIITRITYRRGIMSMAFQPGLRLALAPKTPSAGVSTAFKED